MAKDAINTRHYDVIVAPHITEKSTLASEFDAGNARRVQNVLKALLKR